MSETVYILQNGKKLNAREFCRYFEKKVTKTAKAFKIMKTSKVFKNKILTVYCLDDAAIEVLNALMLDKKAKLKNSPYLYCLKKETEIYSKLKNINFKFTGYKGLKLKILNMLNDLEKKHREIKYSVVNAFNQQVKQKLLVYPLFKIF